MSLLIRTFRFARWASSLPNPPTREQVQGYLQCSGTVAVAWRRAWLASLPDAPAITYGTTGGNRHGTQPIAET